MIRYLFFFVIGIVSIQIGYTQQEIESSVKLLFLGDIMGHAAQIDAAYNKDTKTYNYDSCFEYMQPIFSKADLVIGNLEVTLGTKPFTGYPQFSSPIELAVAVQNAGIDILGTANNHSCDRRKKGILKTIEVLDSLEITHFGTYVSDMAKDTLNPLLIEKNGIKIALLNYTYGTNGIPIPAGTVVNLLDEQIILQDVAAAKALQPDQIIAFVHWGQEYKNLASESQENWFAYFQSLGVNIVIGSHPHVVEPMLWDKEANSLVVYSLGNFISNQRTAPRDGGALFELTLTKNHQQTRIDDAKYILTWVYKNTVSKQTDFIVLPVEEFEYKKDFFHRAQDFEKMKQYAKHARKIFDENNLYIQEKQAFTEILMQLIHIF